MVLEKTEIPIQLDPLTENPVYFGIKNEYLSYINGFREHRTSADQFIGGMPVQLQRDCASQLLRTDPNSNLVYQLTLKVNGIRNLMFLSTSGTIYFIDRITSIFYFKRPDQTIVSLNATPLFFLFDGELIFHEKTKRWEFLIFDVIFYPDNGVVYNWMSHAYPDRLYIIKKAISELGLTDFDITVKEWFPIQEILKTDNIYRHIITKTNKHRGTLPALQDDGLIIQPFDGNYIPFREWNEYNNVQFKWKPPTQLTVDFKIRINPDDKNVWWLTTKTDEVYAIKQADGKNVNAIMVPDRKYRNGDIVECELAKRSNPQRNIFVPVLKRTDKTEANSYQTIMSTLDAITSPFTLDDLKDSIQSVVSGRNMGALLNLYNINKLFVLSVGLIFTNTEVDMISEIYKNYNKKAGFVFKQPEPQSESESDTEQGYEYFNEFGSSRKPFELKSLLERFKKPVTAKRQEYELEFKIYPYIKKGRKEQVQKFTYYYLLSFLKKSGMQRETNTTVDVLMSYNNSTYRTTYTDLSLKTVTESQIKKQVDVYRSIPTDSKIIPLTFKLTLSTETQSTVQVNVKNTVKNKIQYNTIREKHRDSFYHPNGLWRIDITKVRTQITGQPSIETYEIECEYIGGPTVSFHTFIHSMSSVYKLVLFNTGYC